MRYCADAHLQQEACISEEFMLVQYLISYLLRAAHYKVAFRAGVNAQTAGAWSAALFANLPHHFSCKAAHTGWRLLSDVGYKS